MDISREKSDLASAVQARLQTAEREDVRHSQILQFLHYHPLSSRDEIANGTAFEGSDATLKRLIAAGVQNGDIVVEGKARATRYRLSDQAHLLMPLNLDTYFALDVDERQVQTSFNFELIREQLPTVTLFTDEG